MRLLLGIDLGTSYFKVGLFDGTGVLKGLGRVAVEAQTWGDGRVEMPAPAFWQRLRRGLAEALNQAAAGTDEIVGISYSSQANTFLLLDGADRELTSLIFWTDQRARPLDPALAAFGATSEFARTTGMPGISPQCAPAKCLWFARNQPAIWSRARQVMTISDYLTYALTGERFGDASTAVLTGLYSLLDQAWWPEALSRFGIDRGRLSTPLTPGTLCGKTRLRAAELLGLPAGIPFAVGALDHHAAALGSGLGEFADASLSTGTVLAALVLVDRVKPATGCIHGPHTDGRRYYRLTFDPNGAGQLEEYRRRHAPGLDIGRLLRRAEEATGKPGHEQPEHGAAVRALLQKMALAQRELLSQVAGSASVRKVTATGGVARSAFWLQMTADTIGVPVVAVASPERACLGAAMLAGRAAGVWMDDKTAAAERVEPSREFTPSGKEHG